jgi:hypothetical protein
MIVKYGQCCAIISQSCLCIMHGKQAIDRALGYPSIFDLSDNIAGHRSNGTWHHDYRSRHQQEHTATLETETSLSPFVSVADGL